MTRRPGSLDPSKVLWPTVYGLALVLVAACVVALVGALP